MCQLLRKNCFWLTHSKHVTRGYRAWGDIEQGQHEKVSLIFKVTHFCMFLTDWVWQNTGRVKNNERRKWKDAEWIVIGERRKREKKLGWHNYYQRVLLSGTEVKCRLVQHLHKVLQTRHIDFVFHRLRMNKSLSWISNCQNYIEKFIHVEKNSETSLNITYSCNRDEDLNKKAC